MIDLLVVLTWLVCGVLVLVFGCCSLVFDCSATFVACLLSGWC